MADSCCLAKCGLGMSQQPFNEKMLSLSDEDILDVEIEHNSEKFRSFSGERGYVANQPAAMENYNHMGNFSTDLRRYSHRNSYEPTGVGARQSLARSQAAATERNSWVDTRANPGRNTMLEDTTLDDIPSRLNRNNEGTQRRTSSMRGNIPVTTMEESIYELKNDGQKSFRGNSVAPQFHSSNRSTDDDSHRHSKPPLLRNDLQGMSNQTETPINMRTKGNFDDETERQLIPKNRPPQLVHGDARAKREGEKQMIMDFAKKAFVGENVMLLNPRTGSKYDAILKMDKYLTRIELVCTLSRPRFKPVSISLRSIYSIYSDTSLYARHQQIPASRESLENMFVI